MEEIWSYQQGIDDVKHQLVYTSLELETVRAEAKEEIKKNKDNATSLLLLLQIAYQERDQARNQLHNLLNGTKNDPFDNLLNGKRLPQKGKLLQAVVEAGPLLSNLLVAGPLPRWRNPPTMQSLNSTTSSTLSFSGIDMNNRIPLAKRQRFH